MTISIPQVAAKSRQVVQEVERAIVGKRPLLEKIMAASSCRAATCCSKTIPAWPRP